MRPFRPSDLPPVAMPDIVGMPLIASGRTRTRGTMSRPSPGLPTRLGRWVLVCLAGLAVATACHAANPAAPETPARPMTTPGSTDEATRPEDTSELDAIRRELRRDVTEKTRQRLVNLKKRKMLPPAAADVKLSRLAAAEDPGYLEQVARDARTRLVPALGTGPASQYFVYVDRNPARQLIFVGYFQAGTGTVELLGADLASTGLLRRGKDSFLTPTGVFEHLPDNFGYRAQGTKNERGWRGLGGKGSRVWDFGFQQGPREFRQGVRESQMRLLMHATDPDHGEPRLGGMDSKGCVRISANMNRFLDRRSILDRHYERLAVENPDMWLLAPDRIPVRSPGSFLVVGDTSAEGSAAR